MPIAVTGGNGFVGKALIKHLLAENKQIKALVRKKTHELDGAEIIHGDLLHKESIKNLLKDCGCLIHLAHANADDTVSASEAEKMNLKGCAELFSYAVECGVSRIIYLSSAEVHEHKRGIINEDIPLKITCETLFEKHKISCERILEAFSDEHNIEYVILRPTTVYGPGDKRLESLLHTVQEGKFFYVGTGSSYVPWIYVDDLVEAISTCIFHPVAADKKYIVTGPDETLKKVIKTIAKELNVSAPKLQIPEMPVKTAVNICEKIFPLMKTHSPVTQASLKLFTEHSHYSAERIKNELNVHLNTSIETGIKNAVAAYLKK